MQTADATVSHNRDPLLIDLALQGCGAHGVFTWGVLDRLLEEPWLCARSRRVIKGCLMRWNLPPSLSPFFSCSGSPMGAGVCSCWRLPRPSLLPLLHASRYLPVGRRPSWEAPHNSWRSFSQFFSLERCSAN